MKLVKTSKEVSYFGITLHIPLTCNFVSTDKSGEVFAWQDEPYLCANTYYWGGNTWEENPYIWIAVVDLEGLDWTKTLVEIT